MELNVLKAIKPTQIWIPLRISNSSKQYQSSFQRPGRTTSPYLSPGAKQYAMLSHAIKQANITWQFFVLESAAAGACKGSPPMRQGEAVASGWQAPGSWEEMPLTASCICQPPPAHLPLACTHCVLTTAHLLPAAHLPLLGSRQEKCGGHAVEEGGCGIFCLASISKNILGWLEYDLDCRPSLVVCWK